MNLWKVAVVVSTARESNGGQNYGEDVETDLVVEHRYENHHIDNGEDEEPDADSHGHVVQCPGCPAVPLRSCPVPNVVGFTGLKGGERIF